MSNIHKSIAELVGHTPLLELVNFEENNNLKAKVLGKLEYFNPSGSVKDRAALEMLEAAGSIRRTEAGSDGDRDDQWKYGNCIGCILRARSIR